MTTTSYTNASTEPIQSAAPASPLLAAPTPVQPNQAVANTTYGFVLGTVRKTTDGDRASTSAFDDTSSDPTTLRASAAIHYYTAADRHVSAASFLMPVPNGTTYDVDEKTTWGKPSLALQFMALGNAQLPGTEGWQPVSLNTPNTAAQDGFVVGWIDWQNIDGSRGIIQGTQTLAQGPAVVAGSSQHVWTPSDVWVKRNSFTMPVQKGTSYQVTTQTTAGTPSFAAAFVPLADSVQLGSFEEVSPNVPYQAQTDGFLIAYLHAVRDGERGRVDLYSNADESQLTSAGLLASTSIHQYSGGNCFVPDNAATIPVQSGNYYQAVFTPTWGNPSLTLWWVPITAVPIAPPVPPPASSWKTLPFANANESPSAMCLDQQGTLYAGVWNPGTAPGQNAGGYLALWSPATSKWVNLGGNFNSKPQQMCADSSGKIYLVGQQNAAGKAVINIYNQFAVSGANWVQASAGIPGTLSFIGCDSSDNVYVSGTYLNPATGNVSVMQYNLARDTWTDLGPTGATSPFTDMCVDASGRVYGLYTDSFSAQTVAYYDGNYWGQIQGGYLGDASGIGCDDAGNIYFNTRYSVVSCAVVTSTFTDLNAVLHYYTYGVVDFFAILVDGVLYVALYGSTGAGTTSGGVQAYSNGVWQDVTPSGLNANNGAAIFGLAANSPQKIYMATNLNCVYAGTISG